MENRMEINDYYEPTIKTTRNDKQFQKDVLNVTGNIVKTSLNCIEKQHNELEKLENEKPQLISFLEDKIKKTGSGIHNRALDFNYGLRQGKIEAFGEVLDFVNKGGKNE